MFIVSSLQVELKLQIIFNFLGKLRITVSFGWLIVAAPLGGKLQQTKAKMFLHCLEIVSQRELFVCDTAVVHF